ncbi:DUF6392 family protein [Enterobacter kobei]|uniref:DUF6392 family protein n=1 Tax=Enterobacter kobei TaxID=208224 RepID=UPI00352691FE
MEAIIEYFWKSHIELADAGFISRNNMYKGSFGLCEQDPEHGDRRHQFKFLRETQALVLINLKTRKRENSKCNFPNVRPTPLRQHMPREWVHSTFGHL